MFEFESEEEYEASLKKIKKDWDDEKRFTFRYRNEFGKVKTATLKLHNIYKFGINYKLKTNKDKTKTLEPIGIGYIISIRNQNFHNVYFKHLTNLKKILKKHCNYKIIKRELITLTNTHGKVFTRENKIYLVKTEKYQRFGSITLNRNVKKKRPYNKKNKEHWDTLMQRRRDSGYYDNLNMGRKKKDKS